MSTMAVTALYVLVCYKTVLKCYLSFFGKSAKWSTFLSELIMMMMMMMMIEFVQRNMSSDGQLQPCYSYTAQLELGLNVSRKRKMFLDYA